MQHLPPPRRHPFYPQTVNVTCAHFPSCLCLSPTVIAPTRHSTPSDGSASPPAHASNSVIGYRLRARSRRPHHGCPALRQSKLCTNRVSIAQFIAHCAAYTVAAFTHVTAFARVRSRIEPSRRHPRLHLAKRLPYCHRHRCFHIARNKYRYRQFLLPAATAVLRIIRHAGKAGNPAHARTTTTG